MLRRHSGMTRFNALGCDQLFDKLDDIAEKDTIHVLIWMHFDGNYVDEPPVLLIPLDASEVGLPDRFSGLPLVEFKQKGRQRKFLLVAATAGTCDLVPVVPRGGIDVRLNKQNFKKVLAAVDGWIVATTLGGSQPQLCFSVVKKSKWRDAGRPTFLDVRLVTGARSGD